jgi:lysyl-tRNA synthetase class 2
MSLSMMRRDHDTPNGLMEFLVVAAVGSLRERGVTDVSLNFAVAGRYLRGPARGAGRVLRPAIRAADRWFQIESLHRFNAKFLPAWQPRHLLFEGAFAFPSAAVAALRAEGQIPWPGGRAAAGEPAGMPAVEGIARA